jgi:hypothetical protein
MGDHDIIFSEINLSLPKIKQKPHGGVTHGSVVLLPIDFVGMFFFMESEVEFLK